MLKMKWAKSGREQLGKDLGEVEQSLCLANKQQPGPLAPTLVPVFLVLRRTYLLPASPLPTKLVDAFIDLLPAPPDPDDIPFREPSVQTATSSLYVNPRLDDAAAFDVLQELIVYEKEILDERGMGDEVPAALAQIIDHVEKRVRASKHRSMEKLNVPVSRWLLSSYLRQGKGARAQQWPSTRSDRQANLYASPSEVSSRATTCPDQRVKQQWTPNAPTATAFSLD